MMTVMLLFLFWDEPLDNMVHHFRHQAGSLVVETRFDLRLWPGWRREPLFSPGAEISSLRLYDRATGKTLFSTAVPLLTHVYLSREGRYVIGLSEIDRDNPYNLVIYSRDGLLLHKERITEDSTYSANITSSTSNFVFWFDLLDPAIEVETREDRLIAISLRDPEGVRIRIPIHR